MKTIISKPNSSFPLLDLISERGRLRASFHRWIRGGRVGHPVFVIGCGHSGTTLMKGLIGAHPDFYTIPGETGIFLNGAQSQNYAGLPLTTIGTIRAISSIAAAYQNESVGSIRFFTSLADVTTLSFGKNCWVEKTPRHVHHIDRIRRMLPTARFILMMRDGRDVAISLKKRHGETVSFSQCVKRWKDDNRAAAQFWPCTDWLKIIRLESLTARPEYEMDLVFKFLEAEPVPVVANYNASRSSDVDYVDPEVDWRGYRRWLGQQPVRNSAPEWSVMSASEKQQFKAIAGAELIASNYAVDYDW